MPAPVPRARHGRIGGLKPAAVPPRKRAPAKQPPPTKTCPNKECGSTRFSEEDGKIVCLDCYTEIAENNIVAEITFEENAGGRATVQGGTVNDNSRHARTLGSGAYRKVGGGERNSLADVQHAGRKALEQLCPKLGILPQVQIQAEQIWVLAANINFSAGRRTDEVVAACLYAACRRQRDNRILLMDIAELLQINVFRLGEVYKDMCRELYMTPDSHPGHQHLVELEPLIYKYCDKLQFAEKTKDVAADALKIIRRMNRDWIVSGRHPAGLCGACIILAARMNNFQRTVREVVFVSKVADVTIAKRVEEFRRTKASGLTVDNFRKYANRMVHQHDPPSVELPDYNARKFARAKARRQEHMNLLEQRASQTRSPSAQHLVIPDDMSEGSSRNNSVDPGTPAPVEQVPQVQHVPAAAPMMAPQAALLGTEQQNASADGQNQQATPPATQENIPAVADHDHQASKRKRVDEPQASQIPEGESQNGGSPKRQRTADSAPPESETQQQPRYDADGFAIPALPVQPTAEPRVSETPPPTQPKRGPGRPKKAPEQPPEVEISEEELAEEDYLETQIEAALQNGEVQESQSEVEKIKEAERIEAEARRAAAFAEEQLKADTQKSRQARLARGIDYFGKAPDWEPGVILTAAELEAEFENDPEVANCILSETEKKIKEQIWVAHNEDWLRKQAEKELLAKAEKANPTKKKKDGKQHKGRGKKRNTLGDGTVLTESSTPIETPADAARAMLEKRAPMKSQHVDFSALQRIYGRETPSRASSATPGNSGAQSPATREQSAAPSEEDDAGSDDDEEEEPTQTENPAKHVQPATWDNMDEDEHEEEPVEEDPYVMAMGVTDDFGGVSYEGDDDFGSGDEYE
ncbi:Putative transcription factor TFIIB, brf1, TBP-binding domain, cyclin, Cyclin-like superfamily [Septoria linicola]|uniref:Transcription factor TFIIB, brf1, TBP-binding domain, cyclin, Cyclin-like superfamily n=1 Tax=Septoria linicola TaxID=215465 RepID=A0A9Q9ELS9_9PEZI|nr:putative transcription factor TFIIB, brf1, TBP-binding domain, cyclin, Cyclin-like superfamily [Septoria linicola]USW55365.1 Putative transcription factor TFIIB, brf1, TBP-binding domain, cyclin, Cyclin-like superfamily [Septoria linicola]